MIRINDRLWNPKRYNDRSFRARIETFTSPVTITWLYDDPQELLSLYYIVSHLRDHQIWDVHLQVPYLVDARADRVQQDDELFTLKYTCKLLNDMDFNSISIYDVHSYVSEALLNHVKILSPADEVSYLLQRHSDALLFYPDEGSYKRNRARIDLPAAFAVKQRNYATQQIESLTLGSFSQEIKDRDILIVDDILSRGTTLYKSSLLLKEQGAKHIYVFVSHCEPTVLEKHINGQSLLDYPNLIDKIYTTNSLWRNVSHPKVEVIRYF